MSFKHSYIFLFLFLTLFAVSPVYARDIGPDQELSDMSLVRSSEGSAVVKFGAGPLEMIAVGDRLGKNRAEVREITPGRVVIEEFFTGKNGPNRAEVFFRDGEKGGTRLFQHSEEETPVLMRPMVISPGVGSGGN